MEDEDTIQKSVTKLLRHLGYEIETAKDGEEAIELYKKAEKSAKPFDLVMMDLTIRGGMGGEETIKKLLEINPDVKAIVSSGYSDARIMSDYKKYGFKAVIAKPFTLAELSSAVKTVIS
jgi:CheY-like chemotaxis protein